MRLRRTFGGNPNTRLRDPAPSVADPDFPQTPTADGDGHHGAIAAAGPASSAYAPHRSDGSACPESSSSSIGSKGPIIGRRQQPARGACISALFHFRRGACPRANGHFSSGKAARGLEGASFRKHASSSKARKEGPPIRLLPVVDRNERYEQS